MKRVLLAAGAGLACLIVAMVIGFRALESAMFENLMPNVSPEVMYPPAPPMPALVPDSIEDLLAAYETFLRTRAPAVLAALQPGLSNEQIHALEVESAIKLTPDLRALYRWRNGTANRAMIDAFPDHQFIPLEEALSARRAMRKHLGLDAPKQEKSIASLVGYRLGWVGLIMDLAGDGYYFDPDRSEAEGSFFFNFAEDWTYWFFPSFRNYLAAILEGVKTGVFAPGEHGVETLDFEKAHLLWKRFAAMPPLPAL